MRSLDEGGMRKVEERGTALVGPPNRARLKDLMRLIKSGITFMNVITAVAGYFAAAKLLGRSAFADWPVGLAMAVGVFLVVGGSCSVNNYIDRDIDASMSRTGRRPTVTGRISPIFALWFGVAIIVLGLVALFAISPESCLFGFAGSALYLFVYTLGLKRRNAIHTIVGSFAGAMPPLIGWAAADPSLRPEVWAVFALLFMWQVPHFLGLAIRRGPEYQAVGVPVWPMVYGLESTRRQMLVWVAALVVPPLFLSAFGAWFVAAACALTASWMAIGLAGYRRLEPLVWADRMYRFSLAYLPALFIALFAASL